MADGPQILSKMPSAHFSVVIAVSCVCACVRYVWLLSLRPCAPGLQFPLLGSMHGMLIVFIRATATHIARRRNQTHGHRCTSVGPEPLRYTTALNGFVVTVGVHAVGKRGFCSCLHYGLYFMSCVTLLSTEHARTDANFLYNGSCNCS